VIALRYWQGSEPCEVLAAAFVFDNEKNLDVLHADGSREHIGYFDHQSLVIDGESSDEPALFGTTPEQHVAFSSTDEQEIEVQIGSGYVTAPGLFVSSPGNFLTLYTSTRPRVAVVYLQDAIAGWYEKTSPSERGGRSDDVVVCVPGFVVSTDAPVRARLSALAS
jgi:hypothetical protein